MPLPRIAAALFLLLLAAAAGAQPRPKVTGLEAPPRAVLWVGNSFFDTHGGMHAHFVALGRGLEPPLHLRAAARNISGAGLDRHDVEAYLRPESVARMQVAGADGGGVPVERFDAVVLADCSWCPGDPRLRRRFEDSARRHSEAAARHGARPALFMTWAYLNNPGMIGPLDTAYTTTGNENGALVIPAGLAFDRALRRRPDAGLHAADRTHPSLAGSYLGAATAFAALTGRSPLESTYTAGLDADLARFLRQVAWETVQAYYGTGR